jgi:hypothetical protein
MTIETLIETTFHTADADARMQAADAAFLTVFLSLKGEARAARWRGLDSGAKFRLVVRQIEQLGKTWMPSVVEAQIAKYDARYAAGPVEAAIEGALERLAIEHSDAARLAHQTGDLAHRKSERAAATAFTNALIQYRAGVRPEVLKSGARLIPSSTPGKRAHLVTMDGDWVCNCDAGANMHWPLALCIGIEQAFEDMQQYDDGACDPPGDNPMGDEPGDELPDSRWSLPGYGAAMLSCGLPNPLYRVQEHERTLGQRIAEARRATYDYAA